MVYCISWSKGNFVKPIMDEGFMKGEGQAYRKDKNINPLTKDIHPIVGIGVYCTPKISVADDYGEEKNDITFENKKFRFVFMLRVNPYKIRICEPEPDFWVFEGFSNGENKRKFDDLD